MMSNRESQSYLNIDEQQIVRNKLLPVVREAPLREKFFFRYGLGISSALLVASNVVYFRCGFIAYNMFKYNRGRLITPFVSTIFSFQGAVCHFLFVEWELHSYYRPENMWYYGFKSLAGHQIASATSFLFVIGMSFLNAQLNGMIPVRTFFFRNSGRQLEGYKYGFTKLRPFARPIALTWAVTSAAMFVVGALQYKEHCNLLAKLSRKTITHKD